MRTSLNQIKFLTYLVLLVFSSVSMAKSPVWRVSKDDSHLYLGGTIHLLSASDYPLPEAFDIAYSESAEMIFETDIAAMSAPETQALMQSVVMFQDGTTINDVLSPETYQKLVEFLGARQIPIEALNQLNPAGLSLTMTIIELQGLGLMGNAGVDQHYNSRSIDDGKEIDELETVEEQISFINSINAIDADLLVTSTMQDLNQLDDVWTELLAAWRIGDMDTLEKLGIEPMRETTPSLYDIFLVKRNNHWMQEIQLMLNDDEVEFVLVGALHMAGEDGLIEQLEAADYQVQQLD